MKAKFKVGDRVYYKFSRPIGETGTVYKIDGKRVWVDWDDSNLGTKFSYVDISSNSQVTFRLLTKLEKAIK